MKRKPLHPRVHLISGLLITLVSGYGLLFTSLENKTSMQLFFFIGLAFIALAFLKILIKYIKSGNLKKDEERVAQKIGQIPQQELQEQAEQQAKLQQPKIIMCSLCGTKNYSTSNYCHMCGNKLR